MELIDHEGRLRLGVFDDAIEQINHRAYPLWTPMGRRVGWLGRRLGFNQFEFIAAISEEVVFGAAIVNVGYVGTAFAYAFDPYVKGVTSISRILPLGWGTQMVSTPESGASRFSGPGLQVEIGALGNARRLRVLSTHLDIDATFGEGQMRPMRLSARAGASGWTFTRKAAGHNVTGQLRWRNRTVDLSQTHARGIHDWSAGFMRRETFWNWTALTTTLPDGRALGLNLSCGVNETSFSENCLWLNGNRHRLPLVNFVYDRQNLMRPWRIEDEDGRVSLVFHPDRIARKERLNAWVVASNFQQIFGRYTGRLETKTGEIISLEQQPGFAEWHYARW